MSLLNSNLGRIVLHLLAYGAAAGGIAILTSVSTMDLGQYTAIVTLLAGAVIDYLRKVSTPI